MRDLCSRGGDATLLIGVSLAIGLAAHSAVPTTAAAWTDQSYTSATMTAGMWEVPTGESCVAYGFEGNELEGCTVDNIRYDGWGEPGTRVRNYYVTFAAPDGTRSVSFDIDLSTATGPEQPGWSWEDAGVVSGAQATPDEGWTCDELPAVRARGNDWQVPTIYFQVVESRKEASTLCP